VVNDWQAMRHGLELCQREAIGDGG
jgi:hypothetical protein